MVVLETQSASLISKLDAIAVKRKEHRFAGADCRVDRSDPGILIYKAPVGQCLLRCGEARQRHDLPSRVRPAGIEECALNVDDWSRHRRWRASCQDLTYIFGAGGGVSCGVGRNPLSLKTDEESHKAIGERKNKASVVKHSVVPGVISDV